MERTEVHFRCKLVAFIVSESPAAMLQESSQEATSCMSIPHAPGLLLLSTGNAYVGLKICD